MLYLVGTPIGNLGDLSERAREVLGNADIIACEDTRRTGMLLSEFGISGKLFSYHEHNKAAKGPVLIERLKEGADVVLVSDAGMPCISDPGLDLVRLCIDNDIDMTVVPGPVAAITALVMSGLDTRRYHFEGFIPSAGSERKERLDAIRYIKVTIVLYEAPHRLLKTIEDLCASGFGECDAAFCRELTKRYEQVIRLKVGQAGRYFTDNPPKGEFVICLSHLGLEEETKEIPDEAQIERLIKEMAEAGEPTKKIASELSKLTGRSKKELYQLALNLLK